MALGWARWHVMWRRRVSTISPDGPGTVDVHRTDAALHRLIYDIMRRRLPQAFSALLAVIGAGIIRYDQVTDHF